MANVFLTHYVNFVANIATMAHDNTLANWASDLALYNNDEHVSKDNTRSELDDTLEKEREWLCYLPETVGLTTYDADKTGRMYVALALEQGDDKHAIVALYRLAINKRITWIRERWDFDVK